MNYLTKASIVILGLISSYAAAFDKGDLCRGSVVKVSDGDTVHFLCEGADTKIKVRLAEIDTPETSKSNKKCYGQPFAQAAKKLLADRVNDKSLILEVTDIDRYGRAIGKLFDSQGNVNHYMVEMGFAYHYKAYSSDAALAQYELTSRSNKQGLWANGLACRTKPWEWRRLSKEERCKSQEQLRGQSCLGLVH